MVLGNSLLRQFDSSHEIRTDAENRGPGALGLVRFDAPAGHPNIASGQRVVTGSHRR